MVISNDRRLAMKIDGPYLGGIDRGQEHYKSAVLECFLVRPEAHAAGEGLLARVGARVLFEVR